MKKGYFFLMDSIFAIIILLIGGLMINANTRVQRSEFPVSFYAENTMSLLSSANIKDLCDSCACSNRKLEDYCKHEQIKNMNQTLLDYFGELYHRGENEKIKELFLNITEPDILSMEFKIDGEQLFLFDLDKGNSTLISVKKLSFGYYAIGSQVHFFGPYVAEVNVWY